MAPKKAHARRAGVKRTGKSNSSNSGPPDTVLNYRGPIVPRPIQRQMQVEEMLLSFTTIVASDGTGTLSFQVAGNPSGSSEWSLVSGLWEEYRLLKMEVVYVPYYMNFLPPATILLQAPMVLYSVRDSFAAVPSSYDTAWQIGSAKMSHTSKRYTQTMAMAGTAEASFINTRTPGSVFAVGAFAAGLTISANYGQQFTRWLVQFRGRR